MELIYHDPEDRVFVVLTSVATYKGEYKFEGEDDIAVSKRFTETQRKSLRTRQNVKCNKYFREYCKEVIIDELLKEDLIE